MPPAAFVFGRENDLEVFPDVATAVRWMEPVDVIHAEYRMWDATGMAYELGVVGARVRAEPNVVNLEELRDALRSRSGQSARLAPGDEPQEVARRLL